MSSNYRPKLLDDSTFEFERELRFTDQLESEIQGNAVVIQTNRPRFRAIDNEVSAARRRTLGARVQREGKPLASFLMSEFRIEGCFEDDFVSACDSVSQSLAGLGEVIAAGWDFGGFPRGRTILWLERMWTSPASAVQGHVFPLLELLIEQFFAKHALLVLQAFPLEYEGADVPGNRVEERQKALMRHYERRLSMIALPGQPGALGWMYRGLAPMLF